MAVHGVEREREKEREREREKRSLNVTERAHCLATATHSGKAENEPRADATRTHKAAMLVTAV